MPRIFYYCYDHGRPTGGEKHSYQHVDVLNESGYEAYAYHRKPGMRLAWFDNDTAVVDQEGFGRLYDPARDYLVFPEDLGAKTLEYSGRRVIFNKNLFYGFHSPYTDPNTVAVLAVSEHNAEQLRLCCPGLPVHRVYGSIRHDLFVPVEAAGKQPIICSIKKNLPHLLAIYQAFNRRAQAGLNAGAGWSWVFLQGKSEREVAAILGQASAFVFTSIDEGLPRLPIEAMACGSLLVAYRDGPVKEVAPSYLQCHYGDVAGLTGWLEQIVAQNLVSNRALVDEGRQIAQAFDRQRQVRSVCEAWERILSAGEARS